MGDIEEGDLVLVQCRPPDLGCAVRRYAELLDEQPDRALDRRPPREEVDTLEAPRGGHAPHARLGIDVQVGCGVALLLRVTGVVVSEHPVLARRIQLILKHRELRAQVDISLLLYVEGDDEPEVVVVREPDQLLTLVATGDRAVPQPLASVEMHSGVPMPDGQAEQARREIRERDEGVRATSPTFGVEATNVG